MPGELMEAGVVEVPRELRRDCGGGVVARAVRAEEGADEEERERAARRVELSFSSEEPYSRWWGVEVLDHKRTSVRLERMRNGAAVLFNHDRDKQLGRVVSVKLEGKRGLAVVEFGRSAFAAEKLQDVKDGILTKVSVGYNIHEVVLERERDEGPPEYRVTDWEPLEVSLVTIPADDSVGVGRDLESTGAATRRVAVKRLAERGGDMDPEEKKKNGGAGGDKTPGGGGEGGSTERGRGGDDGGTGGGSGGGKPRVEVREFDVDSEVRAEETRKGAIETLAKVFDAPEELRQAAIDLSWEPERFKQEVRDHRAGRAPRVERVKGGGEIGMNQREKEQYSLLKAIRCVVENRPLDGLEREASEATAKALKREPRGFFIPTDVARHSSPELRAAMMRSGSPGTRGLMRQMRALEATSATAGGYTVGEELLSGSMIELLRNNTVIAGLGPRVLTGLRGDIAIPTHESGATAYWLGESEEITDSQQTFGQLRLTPKRLGASTPYSKQLLMQSSIDVEAFVRDDLMRVLAIAKDLAAINGTGTDGEPLGILNTDDVNTVTFGGAPVWKDVVDFEKEIETDNVMAGSMFFVTTPGVKGAWKTTEKSSGTAQYLSSDGNMANGYPIVTTNQVPSNKVVFGDFSQLILADWDGIDVVVDPYALKKKAQIEITVNLMTDIGVRHPEGFCVSTDAGNQ